MNKGFFFVLIIVFLVMAIVLCLFVSPNTAEKSETNEKVTVIQVNPKSYSSPYIGTLVYIPSGKFQRDQNPMNISSVSAFRMSQYEITRAQFEQVTGLPDPSDGLIASNNTDYPVQRILWYHTLVFCNKLSIKEGLIPVYVLRDSTNPDDWGSVPVTDDPTWDAVTANWEADGYRLPTEMEWIWAAIGADSVNPGQVNSTGILKAFSGSTGSNGLNDYTWYIGNSGGKARRIGTKHPNELGLHDISGNVWEWCWDWYEGLPDGTLNDYRGASSGTDRVLHGGSWRNDPDRCAVAFRLNHNPGFRYANIGFRVVRQ